MNDIEEQIEQQAQQMLQPKEEKDNSVNTIIEQKIKDTNDVKSVIDFYATKTALGQEETVSKIVVEKQEELRNDAEAKRIQAETTRISQEVSRIAQEKEKQIGELDKEITTKQKEVERINVESDKAKAFFDCNKDILKYIGVREKKSLKAMQCLMIPSVIIFIIVQILLFPLNFCGLIFETIINIIGSVCGVIKNNALKIILAIVITIIIVGAFVCVYYFGGKFLSTLKK